MNVQPSSLVFVAILAMWAVYLVPQWLRRRETLAQSRTGDRDSEGLRLLERRDRARPGPSTAGLLGPRDGRCTESCDSPEIATDVRRTVSTGEVTSGGVAFSGGSLPERREPCSALPAPHSPSPGPPPAGRPPATDPPARTPDRPAPDGEPAGHPPDQVGDGAAHPRPRQARDAARRRARVLLALLLLVTASWIAALAPAVPWWAALPATGLLLADLVALRLTAPCRAPAGQWTAAQDGHRSGSASPGACDEAACDPGRTADHRRPAPRADHRGQGRLPDRDNEPSRPPGTRTRAHRPGVPRVPRMPATPPEGVLSGQESLADPATWDPVPVPPPTYTLKPKAPDPRPTTPGGSCGPAAAAGTDPVPAPTPDPAAAPGQDRTPASTGQGPAEAAPGDPLAPTARTAEPPRGTAAQPGADADPAGDGALDLDEVLARRRAVNG